MSEWPKQVAASDLDRWGGGNYVSVVPADLARELYEAASDALGAMRWENEKHERLEAALARYEREVGK